MRTRFNTFPPNTPPSQQNNNQNFNSSSRNNNQPDRQGNYQQPPGYRTSQFTSFFGNIGDVIRDGFAAYGNTYTVSNQPMATRSASDPNSRRNGRNIYSPPTYEGMSNTYTPADNFWNPDDTDVLAMEPSDQGEEQHLLLSISSRSDIGDAPPVYTPQGEEQSNMSSNIPSPSYGHPTWDRIQNKVPSLYQLPEEKLLSSSINDSSERIVSSESNLPSHNYYWQEHYENNATNDIKYSKATSRDTI